MNISGLGCLAFAIGLLLMIGTIAYSQLFYEPEPISCVSAKADVDGTMLALIPLAWIGLMLGGTYVMFDKPKKNEKG